MERASARNQLPTVVVGAGLAGLVCACRLADAGRGVLVLERETSIGGRVRTEVTREGYHLDRGFQVIFAAYPALRRHVPLTDLSPRYFASSTAVVRDGHMLVVGHPLYDPWTLLATVRSGLVRPRDALALASLLRQAWSLGDAPLPDSRWSTRDLLHRIGASPSLIDGLVVPFFGGIALDRSLGIDASFFGLVLRSLAVGRAFLPARGMQALPDTLAHALPSGAIRLGTRVHRVVVDAGHARGVVTDEGMIDAGAVVVAVEAPAAAEQTGIATVPGQRGCTTVYFASDQPVYAGKRIVVHSDETLVSEVAQLTNVAPEYAPPGRHLLSATVLRALEGGDDAIARRVEDDVRAWLPDAGRVRLEPVGVVRVPFAQFAQPPGIYGQLPGPATPTQGLFLAGDYLHSSSIQGAMRGGEQAAAAVLRSV